MSRPLDNKSAAEALGPIDHEAGEFWVDNPFAMTQQGENLSAYERNRTFLNPGDGGPFFDVSYATPASLDSDSRSVIAADFNGDGAPDLLVGSVGGGPLRLFLNRFGNRPGRVRVVLAGTVSNRDGIGARLTVTAGGRTQVRDVFPANGFMGLGPPEVFLGLGDARDATITVRWPSGTTTEHSVAGGTRVVLGEDGTTRSDPLER